MQVIVQCIHKYTHHSGVLWFGLGVNVFTAALRVIGQLQSRTKLGQVKYLFFITGDFPASLALGLLMVLQQLAYQKGIYCTPV